MRNVENLLTFTMTGDKFDDDELISKKLGTMFDGTGGARVFKEWLDDIYTILRLKDGGIDAYLEEEHRDTSRPSKYVDPDLLDKEDITELVNDEPVTREETEAEFAARKKIVKKEQAVRKGMAKAFAVLLAYTKGQPKRMIVKRQESKDAKNTPYWALQDLIEKYDHGTETLDYLELERQWNAFTVPSSSTDPEDVFLYLEELSEKLGKVGERYRKDELQYFAKLSLCMPSIYDVCYRVADSNLEGEKVPIEQKVARYKELCKETFRKNVKTPADSKKKDLLFYAGDNGNEVLKCEYCKKKGHVAVKDGEIICRKMKSKLGDPEKESDKQKQDGKGEFKFKCYHCHKVGHTKKNCPERSRNDTGDGRSDINGLFINVIYDEGMNDDKTVLCEPVKFEDKNRNRSYAEVVRGIQSHIPKDESDKMHILNCENKHDEKRQNKHTTFLADSGASVHAAIAVNNGNNIGTIYGANGSEMVVQNITNRTYKSTSGTKFELKNMRLICGLTKNIISIGALMEDGWALIDSKNKDEIVLTKDKEKLRFERSTNNLFTLEAEQIAENLIAACSDDMNDEEGWITVQKKRKKSINNAIVPIERDINDFHDQYGHKSERILRKTAERQGVVLTGTLRPCASCGLVKVKTTNVKHKTEAVSTYVGERMYLDISGPFPIRKTIDDVYQTESRSNMYWMGMSDQYSTKMLMSFDKSKDGLYSMVEDCIIHMDLLGHPIKTIRMDNAGENTSRGLKRLCDENSIEIEYTPPDTPKLNGVIERAFAVRWEIAKLFMQAAKLNDEAKRIREIVEGAIRTAGFTQDRSYQMRMKCSANDRFYEHSGNKENVKEHHIVPWGSIGMVLSNKKPTKFGTRGEPMLMIGYAMNHPSGTYRMYNPRTKSVVISNNVKWTEWKRWEVESTELNKLLSEKSDTDPLYPTNPFSDFEDSDEEVEVTRPENPTVTFEEDVTIIPTHAPEPMGSETPNIIEDDSSDDEDATTQKPVRSPIITRSRSKTNSISFLQNNDEEKSISVIKPTKIKVTGDTKAYKILDEGGNMCPYPYSKHDTNEVVMALIEQVVSLDACDEESRGDIILAATRRLHIHHACIQSDDDTPSGWKQALSGNDKEYWSQSMISEFNNFLKRKAWKLVPRSQVEKEGRKVVPTKLVFKRKDEPDGTTRYKTRCVTLGFMMIPGVDYSEKFSPVATDEARHLQIALTLWFRGKGNKNWVMRSFDVEAAFLEPAMKKKMYIGIHPAMVALGFLTKEEADQHYIELLNSMYGNVDAALKFHIDFAEFLQEECNMTQSLCDPCLFYKLNQKDELVLIATLIVDDCAISGTNEDIEKLMDQVSSRFSITREGMIKKHLGAYYEWKVNEDGKQICECTMDKKVAELIRKYEEHVGKPVKRYDSPGKPGENLEKWEGEPKDLDAYRSITGLAMFFGTKMGPKTANAIRNISRHMSCPNESHWNAIKRLIGYLKYSDFNGIRFVEPEELDLIYGADTDYGNDLETRRSVGCSIGTIGGCLVDYWSNLHDNVSVSSTEAEYKELSKCARGAKFMQMMMEEMLKRPIKAYLCEDNEGAGFLATNKQVGKRTKHIDIHHHFIREFLTEQNGRVRGEVIMIKSEDNVADIGTKNVSVELFKKHAHEIDNGFPRWRISAYGQNGFVKRNSNDSTN